MAIGYYVCIVLYAVIYLLEFNLFIGLFVYSVYMYVCLHTHGPQGKSVGVGSLLF